MPTTLCYTCHFERKLTDYQGTLDCDDPFRRSGIPQVACQGSCGVRYVTPVTQLVHSDSLVMVCVKGTLK